MRVRRIKGENLKPASATIAEPRSAVGFKEEP